ncbi:STAS domain-containing protein [Taibaiella lutea]|uniref:STAS domain-containing protein n=1 Tax=Taibaiella lutea TaxID=2608001 RepID=A0A5M6CPN1_9BACT|nr:STAS domain-containing protein [Taibaiella lutea]KAA5535089.1 STAS domain-containing protein [Taibaiella lutea]
MEFKIDTKPTYTVITPETGDLSVNLAEEIRQKVKEATETDSHNFVIDLTNIENMDMASGDHLLDLHNEVYNNGRSLVFTSMKESIMNTMKKGQYHLSLNLAPTMIEAIDIISMEVLERDLLGEA